MQPDQTTPTPNQASDSVVPQLVKATASTLPPRPAAAPAVPLDTTSTVAGSENTASYRPISPAVSGVVETPQVQTSPASDQVPRSGTSFQTDLAASAQTAQSQQAVDAVQKVPMKIPPRRQPSEIVVEIPKVTDEEQQKLQMHPLRLPTGVVSTGDVRRLTRELAHLEEMLQAIRIRTNAPVAKLPRSSRSLEEFASTNRLNLLMPDDRRQAAVFLDTVLRRAPVIHISFASEASRKFTTELMLWLRTNFDSEILVEIGLEPNMAAGCVVRTKNKYFDFSLTKHLQKSRPLLTKKLMEAMK